MLPERINLGLLTNISENITIRDIIILGGIASRAHPDLYSRNSGAGKKRSRKH